MWFGFALGSAVFAALTSILAKIGIEGVNSNLATAIRTVVVMVMAWGMVFLTNAQGGIKSISQRSWIFLILSGLATGASWLCYYKALQVGDEIPDRLHPDRCRDTGHGAVDQVEIGRAFICIHLFLLSSTAFCWALVWRWMPFQCRWPMG